MVLPWVYRKHIEAVSEQGGLSRRVVGPWSVCSSSIDVRGSSQGHSSGYTGYILYKRDVPLTCTPSRHMISGRGRGRILHMECLQLMQPLVVPFRRSTPWVLTMSSNVPQHRGCSPASNDVQPLDKVNQDTTQQVSRDYISLSDIGHTPLA